MTLKRINEARALQLLRAGKTVYIFKPVSRAGKIEELLEAEAFGEIIEDTETVTSEVELDTLRKLVKESQTHEEEAPVPAEEVAEQTEAPADKSKTNQQVDHQKIVALRLAGWPVKKIAYEMGTSTQTIYNHLKQEDL